MPKKQFAIGNIPHPPQRFPLKNVVYMLLLLFSFMFFTLYSGVTRIIFHQDKFDIFTKDLPQLATYFWPVDKTVSEKLFTLDEVMQSYMSGDNIFLTKSEEIEDLRLYITQNRNYLSQLGFEDYDGLMDFLAELYQHREEVYLLLGRNQPFNYLVLLQNGNEKRPNGGFFGSFAFIKVEGGHIKEMEVIDSYFPDYIAPQTRIPLPQRFSETFGESQAGFIAGNKFWFTNIDGKNIKTLYEKMFNYEYDPARVDKVINPDERELLHNQFIKGVIFLDSTLLEYLQPSFKRKARERQFVNATIDLIRGEDQSHKKQIYLEEVVEYFNQHKFTIAKNLINNREGLLSKEYLQVFLSNTTPELNTFLQKHHLQTIYQDNTIYARDINTSFNKADAFLEKYLELFDSEGNLVLATDQDMLPLNSLSGGNYSLHLSYNFSVPEEYLKFIASLTEKYEVTLTPREQDILVLGPVIYDNKPSPRWRSSRSLMYIPSHIVLQKVHGDVTDQKYFKTEFSQGISYTIETNENHSTVQAIIDFTVPW